jgi:hypothetical protein
MTRRALAMWRMSRPLAVTVEFAGTMPIRAQLNQRVDPFPPISPRTTRYSIVQRRRVTTKDIVVDQRIE